MSDSSEQHSESEFYYLDELFNNEILEQANSLETKLLSEENIKQFIVGQKQENTAKKTEYDMNVFFKFLGEVGETREITNIPSVQLDKLLCNFWFLITLHFGHRARHEARQLKFAEIQLIKDEAIDEEYLEWVIESHSKTRHGDEHEQHRAFHPKAFATGDEKYPVSCYRHFLYRRPDSAKTPESPFILAINHRRRTQNQIWFLNKLMSQASENAQISKSGKITNWHSVRKTCIKTLLD